jgi:NitT/TauT family transport system permease protein
VLSRVFDDIRVIIAVSWTYIIIAEVVNLDQGGIGALAYKASRNQRPDKTFVVLLIILLVGFLQDRAMKWIDKQLFAHKYV